MVRGVGDDQTTCLADIVGGWSIKNIFLHAADSITLYELHLPPVKFFGSKYSYPLNNSGSRGEYLILLYLMFVAIFERDNATLPTYPHPRMQRAPHRPCKKFATCKTTWLCCYFRMSPPDEAKFPVCFHSFWSTSPVCISWIFRQLRGKQNLFTSHVLA